MHGLSTVALRFANVYGPRQDPLGEGGVIAIYCQRRRRGSADARVRRRRARRATSSTSATSSAALIAAAERHAGGAYNIGTGLETTVNELHRLCAQTLGVDAEPRHLGARAGDARRSVLDVSRAGKELGWHPEVPLDEGMRRTWASTADGAWAALFRGFAR